jgi:hypothetical protein
MCVLWIRFDPNFDVTRRATTAAPPDAPQYEQSMQSVYPSARNGNLAFDIRIESSFWHWSCFVNRVPLDVSDAITLVPSPGGRECYLLVSEALIRVWQRNGRL